MLRGIASLAIFISFAIPGGSARHLLTPEGQPAQPAESVVYGAGGSFSAPLIQSSSAAFSAIKDSKKQQETTKWLKYYGINSSSGRCRIQGYETKCSKSDADDPRFTVAFAGSDTPYTEDMHKEYPAHLVIPLVGMALAPIYNIPEIASNDAPLVLDTETLAYIFSGRVTSWRDSRVLQLNPDLMDKIPNKNITVVARSDKSGSSRIFKRAMAEYVAEWADQLDAGTLEYGGLQGFPHSNGTFVYRKGEDKLTLAVLAIPYSIGYTSFESSLHRSAQALAIQQDCSTSFLDPQRLEASLASNPLPTDYYGLPETQHTAGDNAWNATSTSSWPFISYTYVTLCYAMLR